MNVLHVLAPVAFGGGESLLVSLLRERRPGLRESVALLYSSTAFERELAELGIRCYRLGSKGIGYGASKWRVAADIASHLQALIPLQRLVVASGTDVVHAHGYPASLLFYLLRLQKSAIRGVYTHHSFRRPPNGLEMLVLPRVYGAFDVCTGVSGAVCSSMERAFPSLAGRFRTVYNCVDGSFYEAAQRRRRQTGHVARFIQIARFVPSKKQAQVVHSLARLDQSERSRVRVVFVGDGPERAGVERLAAGKGLSRHVSFLGHVPHSRVPDLLAHADFGLFPCEGEGFGIAAAECLAAGLPVLSLNTEVMAEVIGPAGVRVSADRLHEGFSRMLEVGPELRGAALEQAEQFRVGRVKDQYTRCYEQAASR